MGVTAFLSMWINNSAATSIMIPAALAIIDELQNHQETSLDVKNGNRRESKAIVPPESTGKKTSLIIIISMNSQCCCL